VNEETERSLVYKHTATKNHDLLRRRTYSDSKEEERNGQDEKRREKKI